MKKIPKSIRRKINDAKDSGLECGGRSVYVSNIRDTVGRLPRRPYWVIYKLDTAGEYTVFMEGVRDQHDEYMPVCFMPKEWHGLRVSRRVEKVKK